MSNLDTDNKGYRLLEQMHGYYLELAEYLNDEQKTVLEKYTQTMMEFMREVCRSKYSD